MVPLNERKKKTVQIGPTRAREGGAAREREERRGQRYAALIQRYTCDLGRSEVGVVGDEGTVEEAEGEPSASRGRAMTVEESTTAQTAAATAERTAGTTAAQTTEVANEADQEATERPYTERKKEYGQISRNNSIGCAVKPYGRR